MPTTLVNACVLCAATSIVSNSPQPYGPQPPGSSVHGILQVLIGFPTLLHRVFWIQKSNPRVLYLLHCQAGSLPLVPPRKPTLVSTGDKIVMFPLCNYLKTSEDLKQLNKQLAFNVKSFCFKLKYS